MSRLRRILNPETRDVQELRLLASPEQAMDLFRDIVEKLGWRRDEGERRMTVHEDIAHLCCGDSPIRIEVELRDGEDGGTTAIVEGIVPGVGGVADKHLHQSMRAVVLMLGRRDRAVAESRTRS